MNIWTGLLFLEGVVVDASLARELAGDETRAALSSSAAETDNGPGLAGDTRNRDRSPIGAGLY